MVQGVQRRGRGGAGGAGEVQGRCRGCRDGAGYLHHLHLSKHNIRCREVQEVQAHLSNIFDEFKTLAVEDLVHI